MSGGKGGWSKVLIPLALGEASAGAGHARPLLISSVEGPFLPAPQQGRNRSAVDLCSVAAVSCDCHVFL